MPNKTKDQVADTEKNNPSTMANDLPLIIGVGASAGGLEALKVLFLHSQPSPNLAFVVITHLSHDHVSMLPEILQQYTKLNVVTIQNHIPINGNHIYVLPPNKYAYVEGNILYLVAPTEVETKLPIDYFFKSLSNFSGDKAVGVILSGTGSDGAIGLRTIKEKGGLVIVQSVKSARYDGMPQSAVNTGLVDYILEPSEMFDFLARYHASVSDNSIVVEKSISDEVKQVLMLLHAQTGHDFSGYKINTIYRRIQKRMNIIQLDSMGLYIRHLRQNPRELDVLLKELLINVTNFFRDKEAFEIVQQHLEKLILSKGGDYCFRVWVPGCATGEEAYSIAILLQECMDKLKCYFNVQIFGTDIDEDAIDKARVGIYPESIKSDVTPERLSKFFVHEDNHYKVNIDIRKMIIFAVQNIVKDPPFTKLDLLSCRNLLIYFNSHLQKKIFPLFHYSLKPEGLLFLGTSETIGNTVEYFNIIDRRWKIFERKNIVNKSFQSVINFPSTLPIHETDIKENMDKTMQNYDQNLGPILDNILLEQYAPACVIVDDKDNLIYVHGKTSTYLEFPSGEARLQLLDMVKPELKGKLASAIRKVLSEEKEIVISGIQIREKDEFKYINLKVTLIQDAQTSTRKLLLIIFEDTAHFEKSSNKKTASKGELDKKILELQQELKYNKDSLQTTIEELETSNEELKSSNEELQSTNEELQSTNEEIETSKEELQSLNEELTTVNTELESRIEQLSSANDDIKNLLDNTEIATIFLDNDLCIKRFTPKATEIINLIPSDIGRPIGHIVSNLQYDHLIEDSRKVLKTLESKTAEVKDKSNNWYLIRIIPYRTVTNVIDGVVVTFLNIHGQKISEDKLISIQNDLKNSKDSCVNLLECISQPAFIIDEQGNMDCVNHAFINTFKLKAKDVIGLSIIKSKLDWNKNTLKKMLEDFITNNKTKETYPLETTLKKPFAIEMRKIAVTSFLGIVTC